MWLCIDCFVRAEILQILCNGCHVRSPFLSQVDMSESQLWNKFSSEINRDIPAGEEERRHKYSEGERGGWSPSKAVTLDGTRGLIPVEANILLSDTLHYVPDREALQWITVVEVRKQNRAVSYQHFYILQIERFDSFVFLCYLDTKWLREQVLPKPKGCLAKELVGILITVWLCCDPPHLLFTVNIRQLKQLG